MTPPRLRLLPLAAAALISAAAVALAFKLSVAALESSLPASAELRPVPPSVVPLSTIPVDPSLFPRPVTQPPPSTIPPEVWPDLPVHVDLGPGGVTGFSAMLKNFRDPGRGFITGSKHFQLGKDLENLQAALSQLFKTPSSYVDPANLAAFSAALTAAINRAESIAGRDNEDAASVENALALKTRLERVRISPPPPNPPQP
jgi:hypothetical protein